jgi:Maltose acetyltransferase
MSRPPSQGAGAPPPITQAPQHPPHHPPPTSQPPQQYPIQPAPQQAAVPPAYYRRYPPPPVEYHGSSSVSRSRMASSSYEHHNSGAQTFMVEEVERSRMLRNTQYNHFDPTLENDRQRCVRALARYNAACSIDSGMDAEEARTMLLKVFDPSLDTTHKFDAPPREKGTLSHGVRIEAPFTCTYGYSTVLRDRHNCTHTGWRYIRGPHRCEECYFQLPSYILDCRQCLIQACNRRRRNRLWSFQRFLPLSHEVCLAMPSLPVADLPFWPAFLSIQSPIYHRQASARST